MGKPRRCECRLVFTAPGVAVKWMPEQQVLAWR